MKTKYDIGDIIPINFKIKSIEIVPSGVHYRLESESRYLGSVIRINYVLEEEIDREIDNEN